MELFSVMVTGANRGIGLEFVRQLSKLDPLPKYIFATYRNKETIQELTAIQNTLQSNTKLHLIQMDVTKEEDIKNAAKIVENTVEDSGLTLLINNAGLLQRNPFPGLTADMLHLHISTNALAPLLITQVFYPLLKKSAEIRNDRSMGFSRAGILNISSVAGSITHSGLMAIDSLFIPYKMSKTALNLGMCVIASDLKKDSIIVITMCPGWTKTDLGKILEAEEIATELTKFGLVEIEPNESVSTILTTLPKLNDTHTGKYMDRFGHSIPY